MQLDVGPRCIPSYGSLSGKLLNYQITFHLRISFVSVLMHRFVVCGAKLKPP